MKGPKSGNLGRHGVCAGLKILRTWFESMRFHKLPEDSFAKIYHSRYTVYFQRGTLAQMARASALQAEGREFESRMFHKIAQVAQLDRAPDF